MTRLFGAEHSSRPVQTRPDVAYRVSTLHELEVVAPEPPAAVVPHGRQLVPLGAVVDPRSPQSEQRRRPVGVEPLVVLVRRLRLPPDLRLVRLPGTRRGGATLPKGLHFGPRQAGALTTGDEVATNDHLRYHRPTLDVKDRSGLAGGDPLRHGCRLPTFFCALLYPSQHGTGHGGLDPAGSRANQRLHRDARHYHGGAPRGPSGTRTTGCT